MGNRFVFWHRRHAVARLARAGDWVGLGYPVPVVGPLAENEPVVGPPAPREAVRGGGSPGEPVPGARSLRVELERAGTLEMAGRGRGRPRKRAS